MANPQALGSASLAVGQTVGSFSLFLPSFSSVRQAGPNDEGVRKDVRLGQIAAFTVSVGIGLILSQISGQPEPAMVSLAMALVIVSLYEKALRTC